jgi:hypothetical protein
MKMSAYMKYADSTEKHRETASWADYRYQSLIGGENNILVNLYTYTQPYKIKRFMWVSKILLVLPRSILSIHKFPKITKPGLIQIIQNW